MAAHPGPQPIFGTSQTDILFSAASVGTPLFAAGLRSKMDGALGGAQTGYNWQSGRWVFGLEADIQATNQRVTKSYVCPGAICNAGIAGFDAPVWRTARKWTGSEPCARASAQPSPPRCEIPLTVAVSAPTGTGPRSRWSWINNGSGPR
jgi:hypothetical protein